MNLRSIMYNLEPGEAIGLVRLPADTGKGGAKAVFILTAGTVSGKGVPRAARSILTQSATSLPTEADLEAALLSALEESREAAAKDDTPAAEPELPLAFVPPPMVEGAP